MQISQDICRYAQKGRELIHANLRLDTRIVRYLMKNPEIGKTTEFNDNRISLYTGQMGKCYVTGAWLETGDMEIHHRIPIRLGGTDEYNNLVYITGNVHKLVHAKDKQTIEEYLLKVRIDKQGLEKLNKLRILVGNDLITNN